VCPDRFSIPQRSPLFQLPLAVLLAMSVQDDRLPTREPAAVGMSAGRLAAVDRIVRRGIAGGGFPGAAVIVGHDGYTVLHRGYGRLEWLQSSPVVTDESIYDLASLTKVIATTTAAMILYDEGKLPLDAPVRQFLPEFSGLGKDLVTIRQLLSHRSGLPAGRILSAAKTPAEARRMVLATPLGCPPGKCFTYSDLGADVLGWVIENVAGESLDKFVARRVFEPLHMHDTFFRPAPELDKRVAPTQDWSRRGHALRGEVHDESAYALGGVTGHAGLFSTAADLAVFAQMLLNGGALNGQRIVADSTVRLFTTEVADSRALGWETANHVHGAGEFFGSHAFGHTGYTGTSIWIDPERKLFVVLLTNRTYAPRALHPADVIADVRNDLADVASLSITSDRHMMALAMPTAFRSDTARTWSQLARPEWRAAVERGHRPVPAPVYAAQPSATSPPPAKPPIPKPAAAPPPQKPPPPKR
jgi:CubicO group peptidase (beta-lactamase class C family)